MKKHLLTSCLYPITTALLLGVAYPLFVTGIAHLLFPAKANGQLLQLDGRIVGSRLIGQPFTGEGYFHSRPSAAGTGYDASASSGSNLAQTNKNLVARIKASTAKEAKAAEPVPIDLVTASASGLDPDITPAAAFFQTSRIAGERSLPEAGVEKLVKEHVTPRQFGLLGEPRVNVLELNLALDEMTKQGDRSGVPSAR